jgi:hypothetical protein
MDYDEEREQEIISRKGYVLKDLARAFIQNLGDAGSISSGKLLHFTADMITSGGLLLWEKLCWEYAYEHIGVASPRIFHYLLRKFKELKEKCTKLAFDTFCRSQDVQHQAAEIVLILQNCPKKTKTKMPSVPVETHSNENWLRTVLRTTDRVAVRKVWQRNADLEQMLHAGNEMVFAIMEGAPERALFWIKWLMEEDALTRKEHKSGLTTMERGPPHLKTPQSTSVGYYILAILAEVYKEFAEKGMVRMHEEFQALLDIYRAPDPRNTLKRKMDTLAVMTQILTEVPKWKVPAAPSLVPDPTKLERMVSQSDTFFKEVLTYPLPPKLLPATVTGLKQKKVKEPSKEDRLQHQLEMIDQAALSFYKI